MEKIIPDYRETIYKIQNIRKKINSLTDYRFITNGYTVSYDPLTINIQTKLPYYPIKVLEFNQIIDSLSDKYIISKGFLQDWLINLMASTLMEIEYRIEVNNKNLHIELNDIYDNSRKLRKIEKKIRKIRFNRQELMLPQHSLWYYERVKFDFSEMEISEIILFLLEQFDGINPFDNCLEIHMDTLDLLQNPPVYYYEEDLPIGSINIEKFILEITDYYFLIYLREIGSHLRFKNQLKEKNKINDKDQEFISLIGKLMKNPNNLDFFINALKRCPERNQSFFSSIFIYIIRKEIKSIEFINSQPKEYMQLVNNIYSIKMSRINPGEIPKKYKDNLDYINK